VLYYFVLRRLPSVQCSQFISSIVSVLLRYLTLAVLVVLICQFHYSHGSQLYSSTWPAIFGFYLLLQFEMLFGIVIILLIQLSNGFSLYPFIITGWGLVLSLAYGLHFIGFRLSLGYLFRIHMLFFAYLIHYTVGGRGRVISDGLWLSYCYVQHLQLCQ